MVSSTRKCDFIRIYQMGFDLHNHGIFLGFFCCSFISGIGFKAVDGFVFVGVYAVFMT